MFSISANVESIGEGADFRAEKSIQAVQPLFCLYGVISSIFFKAMVKEQFEKL